MKKLFQYIQRLTSYIWQKIYSFYHVVVGSLWLIPNSRHLDVFCTDLQIAKNIAQQLQDQGIEAKPVEVGTTPLTVQSNVNLICASSLGGKYVLQDGTKTDWSHLLKQSKDRVVFFCGLFGQR